MRRFILALAALILLRADMFQDASNAKLPEAQQNLGITTTLEAFGAKCDGTSDDAPAFQAASAWLASAGHRIVSLPARICATSQAVTVGDGRQQSTVLTGAVSGTTITVANAAGIEAGDAVHIKRDDGTGFSTTVVGAPVGTTVTLGAAYSGGTASSGNVVFTGRMSSYQGGGYRGAGPCMPGSPPLAASTIKYIGPAAASTTLGANASPGATTLQVASIANVSIGLPIGVTLDNGNVFWTWVTATPEGTTVKIGDEIPSLGTSGNAVKIGNTAVLRVEGPMLAPVVEGVCLDANNLASVGLDARHPYNGRFNGVGGVGAIKYLTTGFYVRANEFYAGASVGLGGNDFQLGGALPDNNATIGCWLRGTPGQTVAFSQNRFHGGNCIAGGHDSRAAGILIEHLDNNTFIKPFTNIAGNGFTAGAGLYRQTSIGRTNFPNENTYLGAAFVGNVVDGPATGGTIGPEAFSSYSVTDNEDIPNAAQTGGYLSNGTPFGFMAPRDSFGGLALSRGGVRQIIMATGEATDSTGYVKLRINGATCAVSLNTSGIQGLDTGTVQPNTWYAFFLVGPNNAGNAQCLASATTAAAVPTPTLPANYDYYAYVGRAKTDAASDIVINTILPRGQYYIDASGTYTPGAAGFRPRAVRFLACGGGASGASGGRQISGTAISGGAGGSGGGCMDVTYPFDQLAPSISATIGAGGAATSPPGTDTTAGTAGNPGNPTFFGASAAAAIAYGGAGCAGDGGRLNAASASGGGGIGTINTANGVAVCTAGAAGVAGTAMTGGMAGVSGTFGALSLANGVGSAGGAGSAAGAQNPGGIASGRFGCAGGGSGGGIPAAPAATSGAAGGFGADISVARGAGGTSGTPAGGSPAAPLQVWQTGSSAGGGYGDIDASPGSGAGGTAQQCAGGGGGGSTLNTFTAGGGGKGGDGYAFVWELR